MRPAISTSSTHLAPDLEGVGGTITTVAGMEPRVSGDGRARHQRIARRPRGGGCRSAGNLYIADSGGNRIRKVSGGTTTRSPANGNQGFSGDGGPATSASLNGPIGVAVDSAGNLYIADGSSDRIRKVSGGPSPRSPQWKSGLLRDGGRHQRIALPPRRRGCRFGWQRLHRRRRQQPDPEGSGGTITTFAGNGAYRFSGDGGPAPAHRLMGPQECRRCGWQPLHRRQYNNRIRKVSGGRL